MFDSAFILCRNYMPMTDMSLCQFTIKTSSSLWLIGSLGHTTPPSTALPASIKEAYLVSVSPALTQTRVDTGFSTILESEGYFPVAGSCGRCAFCWNLRSHHRNDTFIHCRNYGKALCVVSKDPPKNDPWYLECYVHPIADLPVFCL